MLKTIKSFFRPRLSDKTIKPQKRRKAILFYNPSRGRVFIFGLGTGLILWALATFLFFWTPLIKAFVNYRFLPPQTEVSYSPPTPIPLPTTVPRPSPQPVDQSDFYIFIPTIRASSRVYPNIPVDKREDYFEVLKKGVAHARGSAFPGEERTIYLFAHSTNVPFNIVRYNAVFFLLNELANDDLIILFFNGERYRYKVFDKKIIDPKQVEYLYYSDIQEVVILQTCWPPGTTWKRLLIFAKKI